MLIQEIRGNDLDLPMGFLLVLNNMAAISMGDSFRDTKQNRHILRRYHYVRWMVEDHRAVLAGISGNVQLADPNTKNLSGSAPTFALFQTIVETAVKP